VTHAENNILPLSQIAMMNVTGYSSLQPASKLYGNSRAIWNHTEVTFPDLSKLVLDLTTPEGCKASCWLHTREQVSGIGRGGEGKMTSAGWSGDGMTSVLVQLSSLLATVKNNGSDV